MLRLLELVWYVFCLFVLYKDSWSFPLFQAYTWASLIMLGVLPLLTIGISYIIITHALVRVKNERANMFAAGSVDSRIIEVSVWLAGWAFYLLCVSCSAEGS